MTAPKPPTTERRKYGDTLHHRPHTDVSNRQKLHGDTQRHLMNSSTHLGQHRHHWGAVFKLEHCNSVRARAVNNGTIAVPGVGNREDGCEHQGEQVRKGNAQSLRDAQRHYTCCRRRERLVCTTCRRGESHVYATSEAKKKKVLDPQTCIKKVYTTFSTL